MPAKIHYHHCPICYESWSCDLACTIEPDLEDNGKEFGSHASCPDCDKIQICENIYHSQDDSKYHSQEFWDVYNGFIKVRKR